jgi:hypothetical protein
VTASCFGQVDRILQSIEQEQNQPTKSRSNKTGIQSPSKPRRDYPNQKNKLQKSNKANSLQIWGPKDRLPENIAGQLLAGDFFVMGQSINGHAILIAVDGLFGRTFEVDNLTANLAPGQYYPSGQYPRIHVSRSNPLIFVERGILGCYIVRSNQSP